jgi:hypothetical protein
MAINDNKTALKSIRQKNYLARDFDSFRSVLLEYARQYYPDRIQDFSESSMGGLFLDMAAYVGDNMSFYMDHLYNELNSDTVVETANVERILRNSGIKIAGASSAIVSVDFYVEIPVLNDGTLRVDPVLLPTILTNTIVTSENGINFTLLEDIKFWKSDPVTGQISVDTATVDVANGRRINGNIVTKILRKRGVCASGNLTTETFDIGDFFQFRGITLSQTDITQIVSVVDGFGNVYYEVDNLTHDVVYKNVTSNSYESGIDTLVKDNLKIIPAPYRFLRQVSLIDRRSTLVFGGGSAETFEDDVIPDPSEFAIPLPYSQTFSRVSLNPQKLLQTSTLGVAASNTTLTITYRSGGGLTHNVLPGTVTNISDLLVSFPENPTAGQQAQIRSTIEASNPAAAAGGEDAPTAEELLALVPSIKNSQERIVTKEDLLARIYTMPSNFGRVYRASVTRNPNNPLASRLYIISRNIDRELITSPDSLKINLKRYLNSYRMVSDALDVFDASIINLELFFQIVADPSLNKSLLLQSIISDLSAQLSVDNFHIGQPLIISDVISTIYSKPGVISVDSIKFNNLHGTIKNRQYSSISFDPQLNTRNQMIYPPDGGIFEFKYPDINIVGRCVSNT